jgi:hypothetical protein
MTGWIRHAQTLRNSVKNPKEEESRDRSRAVTGPVTGPIQPPLHTIRTGAPADDHRAKPEPDLFLLVPRPAFGPAQTTQSVETSPPRDYRYRPSPRHPPQPRKTKTATIRRHTPGRVRIQRKVSPLPSPSDPPTSDRPRRLRRRSKGISIAALEIPTHGIRRRPSRDSIRSSNDDHFRFGLGSIRNRNRVRSRLPAPSGELTKSNRRSCHSPHQSRQERPLPHL